MGKYDNKRTRAQKEEDALEMSYRKISGAKRTSKKTTKSNRTAAIVAICIALVAIAIGIAAGCVYFAKTDLNGIILENVTVAGVDVGGMTQAQAIEAVSAATDKTYSRTPMVVKVLESQAQIPTAYVGSLDVKGAVKAAYKFGNSGSQSKRQEEQQIAMNSGYTVDITPYLELDTDAIRQVLSELGTNYSSTLSQSTYEVTGTAPDQKLVVMLGIPEYGLDLDVLYQQVLDAYSQNVFLVEGECGMIEPDPIDLEAIHSAYYIAPVEPTFDPNTFEVVEGTDGYGFDLESAKAQLEQAPFGTTVEIPFTSIAPQYSAKELTTVLYRDELATFTAASASEDNRDTNLRLACEAINGMILYPGDVFSYNDALGQRTAAKGYKPGPSYSGNETVETIGGGICQVSSSLYYCALVADLEILIRESHGFATSYMPLGTDATVSWGSIDFRFRNNTDYPIRIEASASGGNTTVTLIGTDDKDYYVKIEEEVLNTYDYSVSYQSMSANNSEGLKDGDYITEPYTGYDVKTYRCKYNKQTGELISKDLEDESNYRKRDGVICQIKGGSSDPDSGIGYPGIGGGVITDGPGALPPE